MYIILPVLVLFLRDFAADVMVYCASCIVRSHDSIQERHMVGTVLVFRQIVQGKNAHYFIQVRGHLNIAATAGWRS